MEASVDEAAQTDIVIGKQAIKESVLNMLVKRCWSQSTSKVDG